MKLTKEQEEFLNKKLRTCPCCKNEFDINVIGVFKYMHGIGDMKLAKACNNCADEYFEQVKSEYFVEEYKGNKFYKYKDKYYPYWGATYYFDSIEGCRERVDMAEKGYASINLGEFHTINRLLK